MYNLKKAQKKPGGFLLGIFCFLLLFFASGLYTEAADNSQAPEITKTSTKVKNGFITSKNGDVYYYKKNKKLSGWQEIDGKTYYFDKSQNKKMVTGWQTILFKKYYFKSNGQMVTGKKKIGKYLSDSGFSKVVIFFGNGLIEMFGTTVMQSLKEYHIDILEYM